jgi:carbon storage regulator CsrA
MLVLTRKTGESIVLRQCGRIVATITIEEIDRNKARVGIQADHEIEINRLEVDRARYGGAITADTHRVETAGAT